MSIENNYIQNKTHFWSITQTKPIPPMPNFFVTFLITIQRPI